MISKIIKKTKTFIHDINIRTKLLLFYFLLLLIPLTILTSISYTKVSESMEENVLNSAEKSLEQSSTYLDSKLNTIDNVINTIVFNKTLTTVLSISPAQYDSDFLQQSIDQGNIYNLFDQLQGNKDIYHIRLYLRDIEGYSYDTVNFGMLSNISGTAWYKKLLSSKDSITWLGSDYISPDAYDKEEPIISAVKRISIEYYNSIDAVLRVDIHKSILNDITNKANISLTGLTYLINQDREIIASSGNGSLLKNQSLRRAIENDAFKVGSWKQLSVENKKYLVAYKNIATPRWKLVSIIPYSEIQLPGKKIRDYMFIMMLIIGIISCTVSYYLVKLSVGRLDLFTKSISKVRMGDFNVIIKESGNDEIGQIISNFNFMVKEISKLITEKYETGKKIKALELKTLQSQINPHFLYNSLDMINCSAVANSIPEIETMVQSLAKFYKLGLSKGKEVVSIGDEIEHVKAYVTIQNLRFGDGILLEIDIDEELLFYNILKVTLQPLVENSIHHGILRNQDKCGTICISVKLENGIITLTISDNGVGMTDEALSELMDNDSSDQFHGYGIKNINERIKLFYGNQYGLSFNSTPNLGTIVNINIPAVK